MAKTWTINNSVWDTRNLSEDNFSGYDRIVVNSDLTIVTPESQALLSRFPVTMNCDNVVTLDKDAKLHMITLNGSARIENADAVEENTCLHVNGSLFIGSGAEAVLKRYLRISVNGSLVCPESLSGGCSTILHVNGNTSCYPDGAVILPRSAVIDRVFVLRAKRKCYWAAKRMIFVDPALSADTLAARGATFSAEEVLIAESLVEPLIDLIDERAKITIVPDGTAVITDNACLTDTIVRRNGTKLYILGDLEIPAQAKDALQQLEYLTVRGNVQVPAKLADMLVEKPGEITGKIQVIDGNIIRDRVIVHVTRSMLEAGLAIQDCTSVTLDEDIPADLIQEKLRICDCTVVTCSEAQKSAVNLCCEDVVSIHVSSGENTEAGKRKGMNALIHMAESLWNDEDDEDYEDD
ncbi:MAG: hypothetical protein LUJ09_07775 [Firmicutes bacterium]|nr:hypothetical protein [Bacillota bacterium]